MKKPFDMQPGDRLQLALKAPSPYKIFHSLPSEDLFLMILDGDPEDVALAMKYASEEQHRDIMDFYVWEKDTIRPGLVMDWLSRLLDCSERKLIKVIQKLDPDLLIYAFKQYIHVILHEDPNEPVPEYEDGLSEPKTVDNQFYYFHKGKDYIETIDSIILHVFKYHGLAYWNLIQGCRYELSMDIQENAFHWRTNRMQEKGFLDYIESRSIFREMTLEEVEKLKHPSWEEPKTASTPEEGKMVSHSYFCGLPDNSFLKKAMEKLEDREDIQVITWETVLAMNKLISASLPSMNDKDKIKYCLQGGADTLSLALDYLSEGNVDVAMGDLARIRVETLYQAGYSLALIPGKQLRNFFLDAKILSEETLFLLGSPSMEILRGTLKSPPRLFDPQIQEYLNFSGKDQLDLARRILNEAQCLDRLFHEQFKLQLEGMRELRKYDLCQDELTFATLLICGICNIILNRHFEFKPVPAGRLGEIRERAFRSAGGTLGLREEYASGFYRWYDDLTVGWGEEERMLTNNILKMWLAEFVEEFGSIHPDTAIDPKFIKTVLAYPE